MCGGGTGVSSPARPGHPEPTALTGEVLKSGARIIPTRLPRARVCTHTHRGHGSTDRDRVRMCLLSPCLGLQGSLLPACPSRGGPSCPGHAARQAQGPAPRRRQAQPRPARSLPGSLTGLDMAFGRQLAGRTAPSMQSCISSGWLPGSTSPYLGSVGDGARSQLPSGG